MNLVTCLHPVNIYNKYTKETLSVNCGKCDVCRSNRAVTWQDRLVIETKCHPYTLYFTLSYSDDFVPRFEILHDNRQLVRVNKQTGEILETIKYSQLHLDLDSFKYLSERRYICFPDVDLIQGFIKRLRSKVHYNENNPEKERIRYFINSEYGPTTHRIHHHGLLFFESEWLAANFKTAVTSAWSSDNRSNVSVPIGDVHFGKYGGLVDPTDPSAACYVASYVNCVSRLPKIYESARFRLKSFFSKQPPIGSLLYISSPLQEIFNSGIVRFPTERSDSSDIVYKPLPQVFKDRLYPKIRGFGSFSVDDLYRFYGTLERFSKHFFISCFADFRISLIDVLSRQTSVVLNGVDRTYYDNLLMRPYSLVRFYSILVRFENFRYQFGLSVKEYVDKIVDFYQREDMCNLHEQLSFEQEYTKCNDSRYLINLDKYLSSRLELSSGNLVDIDPLIIKSFGFDDYSFAHLSKYRLTNTDDFLSVSSRVKESIDNSHKTRAKNYYLQHRNLNSLKKIYV